MQQVIQLQTEGCDRDQKTCSDNKSDVTGNQILLTKVHQQKTFPPGRNGSIRVDGIHQSHQRHPGGGLLRTQHQYHVSHCISPSDLRFVVSSHSVGLLF